MYNYFEDKNYLREARRFCSDIIEDVQNEVRKQGVPCQYFLVGSGGRNLITYLKNNREEVFIDFDYNLNILPFDGRNDGFYLKEIVRKAFNKIWKSRFGKEGIQDSTSSLTSPYLILGTYKNVFLSIDLAIVALDGKDVWHRLIHNKIYGTYFWNKMSPRNEIIEKEKWLKANNHWDGDDSVREKYLEKKNMYLSRNDHDHPSFVCFIETINEVFQKYYLK